MIIERTEDFKLDFKTVPRELIDPNGSLQSFYEIRHLYHSAIKEVSTKLEILDKEFQVKHDYNPIHHMECRVKSITSTFNKVVAKGYKINTEGIKKITDIAGIRVICKYIDDIYHIANLLLQQNDVELIRESDYIKNPKPSGYRSLHYVVLVPVFLSDRVEKVPVEIQIRTIVMDTWASLEHELRYKSNDAVPEEAIAELQKCAYDMWNIDNLMQKLHKR
ncbi:MAG: GTP pyrophosphokinase family protein [Anaerovoracaceae bacterium]